MTATNTLLVSHPQGLANTLYTLVSKVHNVAVQSWTASPAETHAPPAAATTMDTTSARFTTAVDATRAKIVMEAFAASTNQAITVTFLPHIFTATTTTTTTSATAAAAPVPPRRDSLTIPDHHVDLFSDARPSSARSCHIAAAVAAAGRPFSPSAPCAPSCGRRALEAPSLFASRGAGKLVRRRTALHTPRGQGRHAQLRRSTTVPLTPTIVVEWDEEDDGYEVRRTNAVPGMIRV